MIVNNEPETLSMACLEGTCSYITTVGDPSVPLPVGQKITFDKSLSTSKIEKIGLADVLEYLTNMEKVGGQIGWIDLNECGLRAYLPPTTKIPPTFTPKPVEAPPQPTAIPSCGGGQFWNGSSCMCPSNKIWNGAECANPEPTP
jgi:hypothetical protein